jgi:hypothetical protein
VALPDKNIFGPKEFKSENTAIERDKVQYHQAMVVAMIIIIWATKAQSIWHLGMG